VAYRFTHHSWSCFDIYPEPDDSTQDLEVVSNKLVLGRRDSRLWKQIHALVNLEPKWWEQLGYVSNIEVVLRKRHPR
jgi:hypothetical protein